MVQIGRGHFAQFSIHQFPQPINLEGKVLGQRHAGSWLYGGHHASPCAGCVAGILHYGQ